jgi:hypothetical protein
VRPQSRSSDLLLAAVPARLCCLIGRSIRLVIIDWFVRTSPREVGRQWPLLKDRLGQPPPSTDTNRHLRSLALESRAADRLNPLAGLLLVVVVAAAAERGIRKFSAWPIDEHISRRRAA